MRALLTMLSAAATLAVCAQATVEREVVASGGGSHTDPALQLQWTIGEVAVSEASFASAIIIEGFQQPVIDAAMHALELHIMTDGSGSETSWDIVTAGTMTIVCSGSGYPDNSTSVITCTVPSGCYILRVFDSMGDGMCCVSGDGGYILYDENDDRIIDNGEDGDFGATSAIAFSGTFCVPLGIDRLIASSCDKEERLATDFVIASPNPAVSAEFGGPDEATSGYQFWMFDPDGTYSRRLFLSHTVLMVGSPAGATACAFMRPSALVTLPPPVGVLLNVRIRSRVAGVYSEFGPTCRMKIDPATAACPTTKLIDDPAHIFYSCGITGVSLAGSDKVVARPIANANKYQFEFTIPSEGYLRRIAIGSYALVLGNWVTAPLEYGKTYEVRVRASYDGGSTYCPWGDVCMISTAPVPPSAQRALMRVHQAARVSIFPNPSDGSSVQIALHDVGREVGTASITILDISGKIVHSTVITRSPSPTTLDFNGVLSQGTYLVLVDLDAELFHERLIIQ